MADVSSKLDELTSMVEGAKSMPLSSSCVVNRADLLEAIEDVRELLPAEIEAASGLLKDREDVVEQGRAEAARIVAEAQKERTRLVNRTEVAREAQRQAERILEEAREAAQAMRVEVEDYVDGKLANFEVVLHKTIAAVDRGRAKLRGRHAESELAELDDGAPLPE